MSIRARLSTIRSSFQFRLFSLFTLLTAVITFLFGTLFVVHQIRQDKRHASEKLQLLSKGFADTVRLPLYAENRELLVACAEQVLRVPQIRGVEIFAADNRLLVQFPAGQPIDSSRCLSEASEVRSHSFSLLPSMEKGDEANGNLLGRVRLYRGTEDLSRTAQKLVASALALALLFWLLVACSCYLLLRRVTRSFQALMLGLHNVHGGDYLSRIAIASDDEPGRASAAVNQLAASLAERDRENRRLHDELRAAMEQEIASRERLVVINRSLELEIEERGKVKLELRNLVEQLPVGIIWSDADNGIEHLNRFMRERIGYGHEEVGSVDDWLKLACPDPDKRARATALRCAAIEAWKQGTGEASFYDVQVVCRDGSLRELLCSNQLSGTRTVDIMIDMTEREMLQRQIVRNQKLESIGVLAGGIAHNFNNALTGVMGYIPFARKFVDESDRAYGLLVHAEKATARAAGLASQLLSFANGGAPIRKAVSVPSLVEESLALAVSGTAVVGRRELPASLCYLHVDDAQIRQAFNCICINAVQAMPEGGVLTVRGRNVSSYDEQLPVPAAGHYVELRFEDQGCGIRDEDKANIFTPYFTTKAKLGTGLGLATVHATVTRHGGGITFDTRLGQGTTFTLYLPAARSAERENEFP